MITINNGGHEEMVRFCTDDLEALDILREIRERTKSLRKINPTISRSAIALDCCAYFFEQGVRRGIDIAEEFCFDVEEEIPPEVDEDDIREFQRAKMEMDNIEPLFSDCQIHDMMQTKARSFTREDGAELMTAATDRAETLHPEIEGDELKHEAFRLAYLRGYRHGIEAVTTLPD